MPSPERWDPGMATQPSERNGLSIWSGWDVTCAIYLEGKAVEGADARRSHVARCPQSGVHR